ncbi:hypothetical protein MRB53_026602 [Persea americana]|uniref:Uncharacterized protein n=1 Tax=Persea americana TaxID=3435 RepID=A0ACC2LII0_PERAE|nr:hypothetical protein MRB53_026602 [Persea americana]
MKTKNPYLQKQSIIKDSSSTSSRVFSLLQPAAETGTTPAPVSLSLSSPPSPTCPADIRPPNLAQASPPASQNSALPALPPAHKSTCLALLPSPPTSLHYQESRPSPLPILHNRSPRYEVPALRPLCNRRKPSPAQPYVYPELCPPRIRLLCITTQPSFQPSNLPALPGIPAQISSLL